MEILQIRNATILITYGGTRFLVDPMLGSAGTMPPFPFSKRQDRRNPLNELPISAKQILSMTDVVIFTHLHEDHVDDAAYKLIPKGMKIYVQDLRDKNIVESKGFTNVEVLTRKTTYNNIQLIKTPAQHGHFPIRLAAGHTCGIVFKAKKEKTAYLAGDTIWYKGVRETLSEFTPDVVIVNAGGNKFHVGGLVIMGEKDVLKVHKADPKAIIVATHMEGVNHWSVSRTQLRAFAERHGFSKMLLIPEDGEIIKGM